MNNGRHVCSSARGRNRKPLVLIVSVALILALGIGGTLAYLAIKTDPILNVFESSSVSCCVDETFNGTTKTGVRIQNTGTVDAYIRVAIVANYVTGEGFICPDHTVTVPVPNKTDWSYSNGYYYYLKPVASKGFTPNLFDSLALDTAADNCNLRVEFIASAIQAKPTSVVTAEWGVTPIE